MRILLSSSSSLIASPLYASLVAWLNENGQVVETILNRSCASFDQGSATGGFDCTVAFMAPSDGEVLADTLPDRRLIIVPCPDHGQERPDGWWQQFQTHRFISLSRTLHEQLLRAGLDSAYFQPFHAVTPLTSHRVETDGSYAVLWERGGSKLTAAVKAARQCIALELEYLHIFGTNGEEWQAQSASRLQPFARAGLTINVTKAEGAEQDMTDLFAQYSCVVLPEPSLADLPVLTRAMISGSVVIAPNDSLASDYIAHGVSGLLYDPRAPLASLTRGMLDLPRLALAAKARAERGYALWREDQRRLKSLLINDGARWSTTDCSAGFGNLLRRHAGEAARSG